MNVILIGMPGAGKSTLAEPLAAILQKDHVEMDALIEEQLGTNLQSYIDTHGNEAFKKKERQIMMDVFIKSKNCVISPPGSLIYYDEIRQWVQEHANSFIIFYLHCPLSIILERTNYFENRGVVMDKDKPNPYVSLYNERLPLYEHWSQYMIDAQRPKEEVLRSMTTLIQNMF